MGYGPTVNQSTYMEVNRFPFFFLDWFLHDLIAMRIVKIVPNTHQFIKYKSDVTKLAIVLGYVPNIPAGLLIVSTRS